MSVKYYPDKLTHFRPTLIDTATASLNNTQISRSKITGRMLYFKGVGEEEIFIWKANCITTSLKHSWYKPSDPCDTLYLSTTTGGPGLFYPYQEWQELQFHECYWVGKNRVGYIFSSPLIIKKIVAVSAYFESQGVKIGSNVPDPLVKCLALENGEEEIFSEIWNGESGEHFKTDVNYGPGKVLRLSITLEGTETCQWENTVYDPVFKNHRWGYGFKCWFWIYWMG